VPTIVLAPGDVYRLELPLNAVLAGHGGSQPIPDGEYDVRLSTIVQMLVGRRDGSWADLSPIRLNITSVKHMGADGRIRERTAGSRNRRLRAAEPSTPPFSTD
jgi:hypothetical protein